MSTLPPSAPTRPAAPEVGALLNTVIQGDSLTVMRSMPAGCVDLIVTDPPYLVSYRDRAGRGIANDDPADTRWLFDSSREIFRVLKTNAFCVSFYGWPRAGTFHAAWRQAGFRVVGHVVWVKPYASGTGYTQRRHECAALLAKGRPPRPTHPVPDVLTGTYTGNRLHPTQKPVDLLAKVIRTYSRPGEIVLDPFAGSGSTAVAAARLKRRYIAIELSQTYVDAARARLAG